jgi:hypothetical protein
MKTKWLLIGGVIAVIGILIGSATSRKAVRNTPRFLTTEHDSLPSEQTQAVGWVFGRLIGFPGADKPLLPQSGSMGGQVHSPPTSGARP